MKKIFILILITLSYSNIYAVDYYFFQGMRITLEPRPDKIAVILNQTPFAKLYIENELNSILQSGDELVLDNDYLYHINFSSPKTPEEISVYINIISAKINIVKFATKTYFGDSKSVTSIVFDEFVVRLRNINNRDLLNDLNIKNGVYIKGGRIGDEKGFLLKTFNGNKKTALELCNIYFNTGIFEYAEPNFGYPEGCLFNYTPNDTYYSSQWALNNTGQQNATGGSTTYGDSLYSRGIIDADMDIDLAWDYVKGNNNVIVGVFDTGVDSTHPDLSQNLICGYDAHNNYYFVPRDSGKHGTATLGIIGAVSNNNLGVSGIAGGNGTPGSACKMMSFKLVNNAGSFTTDVNIARAFDTARVIGVYISSNSWGGGSYSTTLVNAIDNCANNSRGGLGCLIFFSSGNNGRNPPNYPGYLSSVICVGASTKHDQKKAAGTGNQYWWGGCYGDDPSYGDLECVAPTICYTTDMQGSGGYNTSGDYYETFNGTSCSCPMAAGVGALIFSVNPNFTASQVKEYLLRGCDKIDNADYSINKTYGKWNIHFGYGRVNAYNSVRLAAGVDVTPPTINHKNVSYHSSTYPTKIDAEIIDQNGSSVPGTGSKRPVLFYKTNKNGAGWSSFDSVYASSAISNVYSFYIPCLGWETHIRYYIRAYDNNDNIAEFPKGAPDTNWLCYYAIGQISSVTSKVPSFTLASQGGSQSSTFAFPSAFTIIGTSVRIYLRHTYVSDFSFILRKISSDAAYNRKCLFAQNGGNGQNITGAFVSDTGSYFWREGTPPYTNGSYKPEYMLNGLNGHSSSGNWRMYYYDGFSGDGGTSDSTLVTLYRTSGTTSPSVQYNTSADTILNFGDATFPDTARYYLKNRGTSNLDVASYYFSGSYPEFYTVINTPSSSVLPNDSTLFLIRANPPADNLNKNNSAKDAVENAVLNINTNDPSKSVFKVSMQAEQTYPVELISFDCSVLGRDATLKWKTQIEQNNHGFNIERKNTDNNNWEKIGFLQGTGNSNQILEYSYTDYKLDAGKYNYRLKQIDFNGYFKYYELKNTVEIGLPTKFELSQNYPNPFNPTTRIDYSLPLQSRISIRIYDITGKEVKTITDEIQPAGYYTIIFSSENLSSGIYFYRLTAENSKQKFSETKRMAVIK